MARHSDAHRELLRRRATFLAGTRTIVVDTETTGLNTATARVLSVALLELTEGRTQASWSSLIDPGLVTLGAGHIHNLTPATLHHGGALPFLDAADTILGFLTPREDEPVVLAGHNVLFDALMLHRELSRLGRALPAGLLLLDTRTVAKTLQLTVGTLAQLAADLRLPVLDAHSAFADASLTANALLLMSDRLSALGTPPDLLDLTVVFDPGAITSRSGTIRKPRPAPPPLSPAHAASHAAPLRTKRQREKQLSVCVAEGCNDLPTRVEDAITSEPVATSVAAWLAATLTHDDWPRTTRGLLAVALARAVSHTSDPALPQTYLGLLADRLLPEWGPCTGTDRCDACADVEPRTCRFTRAQERFIDAYLAPDDDVDPERAEAFMPFRDPTVRYGRGRPSLGWFGKLLHTGNRDLAGYGVVRAARGPSGARNLERELAYLRWAWKQRCVGPEVGDALSKLLVQLAPTHGSLAMKAEAVNVCDTALSVRDPTDTRPAWDAIAARRARTQLQLNRPPREPALHPRNRRLPRPSRYYLRAAEASPLAPSSHGHSTS